MPRRRGQCKNAKKRMSPSQRAYEKTLRDIRKLDESGREERQAALEARRAVQEQVAESRKQRAEMVRSLVKLISETTSIPIPGGFNKELGKLLDQLDLSGDVSVVDAIANTLDLNPTDVTAAMRDAAGKLNITELDLEQSFTWDQANKLVTKSPFVKTDD